MNITEAIKELFAKHNVDPKEVLKEEVKVEFDREKFEDVALIDGTIFMIEPAVEAGAAVMVMVEEVAQPVPAGEYELEDGRIIVVEEAGVVAAVNAPAEEVEEPAVEEEMNEEKPEREAKKVIESTVTEKVFNETVAKFEKQIEDLTTALSEETAAKVEFMNDVKELLSKLGDEPKEEPKEVKFSGFGEKKKNIFNF